MDDLLGTSVTAIFDGAEAKFTLYSLDAELYNIIAKKGDSVFKGRDPKKIKLKPEEIKNLGKIWDEIMINHKEGLSKCIELISFEYEGKNVKIDTILTKAKFGNLAMALTTKLIEISKPKEIEIKN